MTARTTIQRRTSVTMQKPDPIPPTKVEDAVEATEEIDHPSHYNLHPSGVECIDIVEHLTFNVGSAVKYAWRAGLKVYGEPDGPCEDPTVARIRDLKKAAWYINREIERLGKEFG